MDLLIIPDKIKSHYVCIKYFNKLIFNEQKTKTKNTFVNIVHSVLGVKKFWYNIKKFVWKKMVNKL